MSPFATTFRPLCKDVRKNKLVTFLITNTICFVYKKNFFLFSRPVQSVDAERLSTCWWLLIFHSIPSPSFGITGLVKVMLLRVSLETHFLLRWLFRNSPLILLEGILAIATAGVIVSSAIGVASLCSTMSTSS